MSDVAQLRVLVFNLPASGVTLRGQVSFSQLGIADSELVSCPEPVRFELQVTPLSNEVLAQGRLESRLRCRCDRCLGEYDLPIVTEDVCHLFEGVEAGEIDLTEGGREDILLAFPQRHLCRLECCGLCPGCGQDLNKGACTCTLPESSEGPWAALDGLNRLGDELGPEESRASE